MKRLITINKCIDRGEKKTRFIRVNMISWSAVGIAVSGTDPAWPEAAHYFILTIQVRWDFIFRLIWENWYSLLTGCPIEAGRCPPTDRPRGRTLHEADDDDDDGASLRNIHCLGYIYIYFIYRSFNVIIADTHQSWLTGTILGRPGPNNGRDYYEK